MARFYRLFIILLILLIVGVSLFFYLRYLEKQKVKAYEGKVKILWKKVVKESTFLKQAMEKTKQRQDFKKLALTLSHTHSEIKKEKKEAPLKPPSKDVETQKKLEKVLQGYLDYLSQAQKVSRLVSLGKGKEKDIKSLKRQGIKVKNLVKNFVKETKFIKENIPPKVFEIFSLIKLVQKKDEKKPTSQEILEQALSQAQNQMEERQKEEGPAVQEVTLKWLEAEKAGGTEVNWELSSARFKDWLLKDFPPEEKTKERFIEYFQEGEAHARLIAYEIAGIFIITPEKSLVSYKATRQDIEGKTIPEAEEQLPLVKEGDFWKVDGVNF